MEISCQEYFEKHVIYNQMIHTVYVIYLVSFYVLIRRLGNFSSVCQNFSNAKIVKYLHIMSSSYTPPQIKSNTNNDYQPISQIFDSLINLLIWYIPGYKRPGHFLI